MTRTLRLKLFYLALIIIIAAAVIGIVSALPSDDRVTALLAIAFLAFLPGRIHASVYRDFYRGRRLLGADRPREALQHFRAFLANLDGRPWKKKLIWLSWSFYTVDAAAMAWNNIGVALTDIGAQTEAKEAFETALTMDPQYPLPHVNLARLAMVDTDRVQAQSQIDKAALLGYRRTSIDQLIHQTQALAASIEGRGQSKSATANEP